MIAYFGANNYGRGRKAPKHGCRHSSLHECYEKHPDTLTDEQMRRLANPAYDWACREVDGEANAR